MDSVSCLPTSAERDWQTVSDGGPVRIAMIGLGWWTKQQAIPAVEASELCETTVLVSSSAEKASSCASLSETIARGISYDEFHDGVAADAYDAVYVVTPNALHLPFVETAAELGKAVLCEKPMESTLDRAERLVAACDEADVPLMVAYRMQTEPAVRRMREFVQAGSIGDPVQVHGHMSQQLLDLIPNPDQWRLDPELSGGATAIDIGMYPLNTTRFVLDDDPTAVSATVRADDDLFEAVGDQHASFTLEFPTGVTAVCTVSNGAASASHLEVIGTDGSIRLDPAFAPWTQRELRVSNGESTANYAFEQIDQMTEEFDYFADRVLSGGTILPDGDHALVDMAVAEAIYESGDVGRRLEL